MSKFISWIDERLPVSNFVKNHLSQYYAPKNFNIFYYFGALAIFIFILQIVTGIFLTINYKPDAAQAFASVEYIMRDVEWGWLVRYLHSTDKMLLDSNNWAITIYHSHHHRYQDCFKHFSLFI